MLKSRKMHPSRSVGFVTIHCQYTGSSCFHSRKASSCMVSDSRSCNSYRKGEKGKEISSPESSRIVCLAWGTQRVWVAHGTTLYRNFVKTDGERWSKTLLPVSLIEPSPQMYQFQSAFLHINVIFHIFWGNKGTQLWYTCLVNDQFQICASWSQK